MGEQRETAGDSDSRILEAIRRSSGSMSGDIVLDCQDLTWNQIFLAIDRLSREGRLILIAKGHVYIRFNVE